jgi:MOSC domain-containing protein YiiM
MLRSADTIGDPVDHRTREELEQGLAHVVAAPRDRGRLEMLVVRPAEDHRATPSQARCTVDGGVDGDDWASRGRRPNPDKQITVMNARYLDLIAGSRDRWPLAGDQLVVDLDLSDDHLAVGDRLRIGDAELEVTAPPHTGCAKFRERFGEQALRVANDPEGRRLHLRGIYVRVVVPGTLYVGAEIERVPAVTAAG